MRSLALLLGLLAGCSAFPGLGLGTGGGDAGSSAAGTAPGDGGTGTKGVDCIVEPESGATLCTAVSTCPSLAVDHDVYPHCGFRPGSPRLELACACAGAVCPLGTADTCEQAKKLLNAQSESQVCAQVAEDRCTTKSAAPTTSPSATSTCDKACAGECGGAPGCLKLCGC